MEKKKVSKGGIMNPEKTKAILRVECDDCSDTLDCCENCGESLYKTSNDENTILCYQDDEGEYKHFCSDQCFGDWNK